MADSRYHLFRSLPFSIQEDIFSYLPEVSGMAVHTLFGEALYQRRFMAQVELNIESAARSTEVMHKQQRRMIYWYQHLSRCHVSSEYLRDKVILNPCFNQLSLSYQLSALCLFNKLNGKADGLLRLNNYIQQILSIYPRNMVNGVVCFSDVVGLFDVSNQVKLIQNELDNILFCKNSGLIKLLSNASYFLSREQLLALLGEENLSKILQQKGLLLEWYADAIANLINRLPNEDKISRLALLFSCTQQHQAHSQNTKVNTQLSGVLYLLNGVLPFIDPAAFTNQFEHQKLLTTIYDYAKSLFNGDQDRCKNTRLLFIALLKLIADFPLPANLKSSIEVMLEKSIVEEDIEGKLANLSISDCSTSSISFETSVKEKWGRKQYEDGMKDISHLIELTMNKDDLSNLVRFIDRSYRDGLYKEISVSVRWCVLRVILRNEITSEKQRDKVFSWMRVEFEEKVLCYELIEIIPLLEMRELGLLFEYFLQKYERSPCVSVMDALLHISRFDLPSLDVEDFFSRVCLALKRYSSRIAVSITNGCMVVSSLAKQYFSEEMAVVAMDFLCEVSLPPEKWSLLGAFSSPRIAGKYWESFLSCWRMVVDSVDMSYLTEGDAVKSFAHYIHLAAVLDAGRYEECLAVALKAKNESFVFGVLIRLTKRKLPPAALEKCMNIFNSSQQTALLNKKYLVAENLAAYSNLPEYLIGSLLLFTKNRLIDEKNSIGRTKCFSILKHLLGQERCTLGDVSDINQIALSELFAEHACLLGALDLLLAWRKLGGVLDVSLFSEAIVGLLNHQDYSVREAAAMLINHSPEFDATTLAPVSVESVMLACIAEARGGILQQAMPQVTLPQTYR